MSVSSDRAAPPQGLGNVVQGIILYLWKRFWRRHACPNDVATGQATAMIGLQGPLLQTDSEDTPGQQQGPQLSGILVESNRPHICLTVSVGIVRFGDGLEELQHLPVRDVFSIPNPVEQSKD